MTGPFAEHLAADGLADHLRRGHAYPFRLAGRTHADLAADHQAEHDPFQWGGDWDRPAPPGSRRAAVRSHRHDREGGH